MSSKIKWHRAYCDEKTGQQEQVGKICSPLILIKGPAVYSLSHLLVYNSEKGNCLFSLILMSLITTFTITKCCNNAKVTATLLVDYSISVPDFFSIYNPSTNRQKVFKSYNQGCLIFRPIQ